jgi:helix-turn-helix, Psq domain
LTVIFSFFYFLQKYKMEEAFSPYTDKSFDNDSMDHAPNFSGGDSRIASYVPNQKPEWKRYKQYTRNDILSAIECVRTGMSALQASRKFGVPSRTLYDKVKKLGITTGRPMTRTIKRSPSNGGGGSGFPFGLSGANHPFMHQMGEHPGHHMHPGDDERMDERGEPPHMMGKPGHLQHSMGNLLDPAFLQQALEGRGGDMVDRSALHAMHALAAVAHAAANGMSTSPENRENNRSPSPSILMKYMRNESSTPVNQKHMSSPPPPLTPQTTSNNGDNSHGGEEDRVEDLSMSKKSSPIDRSPSPQMMPHSPQHTPPQMPTVIVPSPTLKIKSELTNVFDEHQHDNNGDMQMPSAAEVRMD